MVGLHKVLQLFKLSPLNKKLIRDLIKMRTQAFAIILVVASGVAVFVMSLSTLNSLHLTQETYYKNYHFADIFTSIKRAPLSINKRINEIPDIKVSEPRIKAFVNMQLEGFSDPIVGQIISVPSHSKPLLNQIYLREGRMLEPSNKYEILVSEGFAKAHNLKSGNKISAIINGKKQKLTVVGVALSPEFIYQIAPGGFFPDFKRYVVAWMNEDQLSEAYGMKGAFNDLSIKIVKGADVKNIILQIDNILNKYGSTGAYERTDQLSHRFLSEELKQLRTSAFIMPMIFFGVAAFLINVIISRIVAKQRIQIAALKAFGYRNFDIGWHYFLLSTAIISIGLLVGCGLGMWMGRGLSRIYSDFYNFPFLVYKLNKETFLSATFICIGASIIGSWFAVKRVVSLTPAVAMLPEAPHDYKKSPLLERFITVIFSKDIGLLIIRNISRKPIKTLFSVIGIAAACAIMMLGNFQEASLNFMLDFQFKLSQKDDLKVTFIEPTSKSAIYSLNSLDGVNYAEGYRAVAVRLKNRNYSYLTTIQGLEKNAKLQNILDINLNPLRLPEKGIILTKHLGEILKVNIGEQIEVSPLEGSRKTRIVPVVGFSKEFVGLSAYMDKESLNKFLNEDDAISGALLTINKAKLSSIYNKLNQMPKVSGISVRNHALQSFHETIGNSILVFTFIVSILGGLLSFGVIYNNARITLEERALEISTLRVLGYTINEVTAIILGEILLITTFAIFLGFYLGYLLCKFLTVSMQSDLYRIPLILERDTFALSGLVILISSIISCYMIYKNLTKLDFIEALKTKE